VPGRIFKYALSAAAMIVLLQLLAGGSLADPPMPRNQVRSIRYWTAPDHTRIVLDMSSESSYRVSTRTNPYRVVIDIPSGTFVSKIGGVEVKDGVVDRIRINKLRSGAQIVLDLPSATPYKHFALAPNKTRPHRIVIDVERVFTRSEITRRRDEADRIARSGDYIVIVDPGHGGSQPGRVSRGGIKEKTIALRLSKLLAREISAREGYKAVLTRKGDYDVDLGRRISIARSHGGHCFISVHHNGHSNTKARGTEVYFLSLEGSSDENAEAVAERENMLIEMGNEGEEITEDLKSILFDLNRTNSMNESSLFAGEIARSLRKDGSFKFRGIKQANFVVLRSIAMPSVLVEIGFLSNRKDAALLKDGAVLERIAERLADGTIRYLERYPPDRGGEERPQAIVHVVSYGETLWAIARKYGVSVNDLRAENGLGGSSTIRPGQKLRITK
jgi:N-acetylmuramoyl-L-alanine amidase